MSREMYFSRQNKELSVMPFLDSLLFSGSIERQKSAAYPGAKISSSKFVYIDIEREKFKSATAKNCQKFCRKKNTENVFLSKLMVGIKIFELLALKISVLRIIQD